ASEVLVVEMAKVRARVGRLGELDLLGARNRQVEEDPELEKAAQRDQVQVLARGRDRPLAGVAPREKTAARQVAPIGLQDPYVDVLDPRRGAVAADEVEELDEKALVARQRGIAAAFVAQLLQE